MGEFCYKDTAIDYECVGDGAPILFLHGWGMDRRIMSGAFEPIFENGCGGFRRIYLDLPGMGRSKAGADIHNSDDMLEVLCAFARKVVGEPFILAGESYGGYLSRGFVRMYPELLRALILLCPLVYPASRCGDVEPLRVIRRDDEFLETLSDGQRASFCYLNVILERGVYEAYERDIMPALRGQNRHFLDEVLDGAFSFDPDDLHEPFGAPTLILAGRQDTEVGYKDQFGLLRNYPDASYCALHGAGHNLQIEQPSLFRTIVGEWLKTL